MKICYDCKWCKKDRRESGSDFSQCANPKSARIDPVTGDMLMHYCSTERAMTDSATSCTKEGAWFEPIEDATDEDREPDEPSDPDGECFRGGEWAAAQARESEWIQRNLK